MAITEISDMQKDAIGEILNISMGSAATAVSELLNAKVWITTPRVRVAKAEELEYKYLEPAVCVKIVYIKGLSGSNLMVLKQDDVQLILNQLMGQPLVVSPDFEFDELNISAVSEVMNQMMGASATALSDFLGFSVDISTPTPYIMDELKGMELREFEPDQLVVGVTFDLTIDGVIKSEFVSLMTMELATMIADKMLGSSDTEENSDASVNANNNTSNSTDANQPTMAQQNGTMPPINNGMPQMNNGMPQMNGVPPMMGGMPQYDPNMQPMPQGYPPQYPYPQQMPYGYGYPPMAQPINIQSAQLNQFESPSVNLSGEQKDNLQLLMGVPLQISVEIGTAKRKVKEILEFTQGTIIELERQAGAPVDVVVNGNLIARGDVVVIDDNFAVRITEIIKSKFMDSLSKE